MLVVVVGWTLYYCFALESSDGQTLGKRVMKLRVVSADGSAATDAQIAKRTIVRIVDWGIIGLIAMLVSGDRRQRLGDMVAATVVTDAAATAASATPDFAQPSAPEMPAPAAPVAAKEPKRRRGLEGSGQAGDRRVQEEEARRRLPRWSPRCCPLFPLLPRHPPRSRSPSAAGA